MEIKNQRQKMLFIVVGVIFALYVGDSFIFSPLAASWKDRAKQIADLRQKVSAGTNLINHAASIQGQWDRMQTNALPANTSLAEGQMLKAFERWERAAGLTRISIKPQWKDADTDYKTLECRADYNGDIAKFTRLLYEIEKDPMGLKVDNIEISARDDYGAQLTLGLQVSGLLLNLSGTASQP